MKKETQNEVKSTLCFAKIEVCLELLGLSKAEITEIENTIKNKLKKEPKKYTLKPVKGKYLNSILEVLSNNSSTPYTVDQLSKEVGISVPTIRTYIKQLRDSKKVKLVDWDTSNTGPATLLYQIYRSPLKALKTVTQAEGYDSVCNFVKNNKNLLGKGVMASSFAFVVEQENLTIYPLLLGIGVVKGYKVSELKRLAKKVYSPVEGKPKKKCTKKTKAKRKYTRKVKAEPVIETKTEMVNEGPLSIIEKLFKKNVNKTTELIKF